ncbi:MAG TPA: DUF4082 domain-containing protein [Acidimicrobiales bacterium]|nr:DUF4082 domain-containing protein [Acidimicrobiales bacterium]
MNGRSATALVQVSPSGSTVACPCSVFNPLDTPANLSSSSTQAVQVGMKFSSSVAGYVTAVRFYKGPKNTGTHIGHLWSRNGALLASITFTNETVSGWQQASFSTPVAIAANTTYIVSYRTQSGHYSFNTRYFSTSGVDNGPLHALRDGEAGPNGVIGNSRSSLPTSGSNATNYWVDVVFNTSSSTAMRAGSAITIMAADRSTVPGRRSSDPVTPRPRQTRSLSCVPKVVLGGDIFTCELRLDDIDSSDTRTFAVEGTGSDVLLPATLQPRARQNRLKFQGQTLETTAPAVIAVTVGSGDDTVEDTITVLPAPTPILGVPERLIVKAGEFLGFQTLVQDSTGFAVLSVADLPYGASLQPQTGEFEWTPALAQQGDYSVAITAKNAANSASTKTVRISVDSGQPQIANSSEVVCAAGSIATLNGRWLSGGAEELSDPSGSSLELGGTRVRVNGAYVPVLSARLYGVQFLCPSSPVGGRLEVALETESGSTVPVHTTLLEASPTLQVMPGASDSQGSIAISATGRLATLRDYRNAGEPAQPGDLLSIRGTGLGAFELPGREVLVNIGGIYVQVESVTAVPEEPGVSVITVRLPSSVPAGDAVPVQVEVTSGCGQRLRSNTVTIAIEEPNQ